MDKITHEIRLMQWTSIVRECRGSGMSVKAYLLKTMLMKSSSTTDSAASEKKYLTL